MKRLILLILVIFAFKSVNAQTGWVEQTSPVTIALYSVSSVNDSIAWACGAGGKVLRTVNGGANWKAVTGTGITASLALYNIFGLDSSTALVTGSSTTSTFVYKTTNGGLTFSQVFTQTGGFIDAIWMVSPAVGYLMGDPVGGRWSLWRTTNGGNNWDSTLFYLPQAAGEASLNNSLYAAGTQLWFGTSSGRVYYSSNAGLSFTSATTPGIINVSSLWFNSTTGAAVGDSIDLSVNNGANWSRLNRNTPGAYSGVTGRGANFWACRSDSILISSNNGASYSGMYKSPAGSFYHIQAAREGVSTVWAVRSNGGISKLNASTGITQNNTSVPEKYELSQNYPNPFNPATNIRFAIPQNGHVMLKVYDMLGKEMAVLVNNNLNAGSYTVDFNGTALSSGIYFYTLEANNFKETKKMILSK